MEMSESPGESFAAAHVEPVSVRWGDVDSMGHVNNARYFTYCESARMSYFAAIRLRENAGEEKHGPALAAANLNFRRQVHWPAELDVRTRVSEIGRTSFRMEYEIVHRESRERVADGAGVVVWVDYATGRPIPLPEALKREIRRLEGMPETAP
jgi:acyl-CoA thioester hydrolase